MFLVGNRMDVRLLLLALICIHASCRALAEQPEEATVIVKGSTRIAETDDNYVCATMDWWPPEKCNYNQCSWGQSSILNLDLDHPFLAEAIQAFGNLRIRLGGSLQDRVVYDVGTDSPCTPFQNVSNGLFGFSVGCLSMDRWDELNDLFQKTGYLMGKQTSVCSAIVTFGLNALYGRYNVRRTIWAGKWNSTNAYDFVKYTISKGYPVDSWEFGNTTQFLFTTELLQCPFGSSKSCSFIQQLYKAPLSQPLLLAPGGFFDQQWYSQLLQTSGHGVVSALTHHVYNLGGGITLLLINLSNTTRYNVTLQNDINVSLEKRSDLKRDGSFTTRLKKAISWLGSKPSSDAKLREEYHLTAKDGDLQSKTMLLNGAPLELGDDGSIPALSPVLVDVSSPVYLAPTSIAFVALPMFEAKACS
ncbi:hypothetical protein PR202_ga26626 [Eleusine coracana subsp. coracana]|uniref:Heparanase-like protein 1 n=1 Tax=Eleusine coracana subsp. coracana TaxID=191504 RepID=A0AAV5DEJ1_ELECO|nr:hypothetical protein PR202_ga26626 [Eleusine coracana subsp. coracana]